MRLTNYGKRKYPQHDKSVLLQIRSTHWDKFNQSVVINCTSFYPSISEEEELSSN